MKLKTTTADVVAQTKTVNSMDKEHIQIILNKLWIKYDDLYEQHTEDSYLADNPKDKERHQQLADMYYQFTLDINALI